MLESWVRRNDELWSRGRSAPPYQAVAERGKVLRDDETRRIDNRQPLLIVGSKADAYRVFTRSQSTRVGSARRERGCVRWHFDARSEYFLTVSADDRDVRGAARRPCHVPARTVVELPNHPDDRRWRVTRSRSCRSDPEVGARRNGCNRSKR